MPGVVGLLGVIALNYLRHRRGLPTICAVTRRHLPRPVSAAFLVTGAAYLITHVWRGYPTVSRLTTTVSGPTTTEGATP